jgi:hypothetical protein
MAKRDRIQLHADRALAELERARGAASAEAALAHLALSELHLAEMHAVSEAPPGPKLILVGSEPAVEAGPKEQSAVSAA